MATAIQNFRVDVELKEEFNKLAEELGVTTSSLFTAYMKKAVAVQGIPFSMTIAPVSNEERVYTIESIRRIVAPIAKKYGVKEMYLFGSYARGDANMESDIDIVIENENTQAIGFGLCEMQQELENVFGKKVDLIPKYTIKFDLDSVEFLTVNNTKEWLEKRFVEKFERERVFLL